MSSPRILVGTFWFLICVETTNGQSRNENLHQVWEFVSIELLGATIYQPGEEMRTLDFRSDTKLIFEIGGHLDSISYKLLDNEIQLLDSVGHLLEPGIIWKIDRLTKRKFDLVEIKRDDKTELVRFRYRSDD